MPSVLARVKELKRKFYDNAPAQNRPKIEKVLAMYKDKSNMNFTVVQNMVLALYSPTLMGKKNVDKMYENFLSKYGNEEAFPMDYTRGMTNKEKLQERRDRILGRKQSYQLFVAIYTQEKRMDPKKREEYLAATEKQPKDARTKKIRGLAQITRLNITVQAYSSRVFEELRWKLARRGTREFRQLYPICMTDKDFAERDRKVPGYIDAIYIMDWTAIGRYKKIAAEGQEELPQKAPKRKPTEDELAAVRGPKTTRKRSGDKVAIAFKYCSYK